MRKKKLIYILLFSVISISLFAQQNSTNSPYTRFGYGKLVDAGFARTSSMGGIGIGFRKNNTINVVNPASYSSIDSTSFIFEFGFSGLLSKFSTASGGSAIKASGNINYFGMQFPVTKWMGMSVGIVPYSFIGYNFNSKDSTLIPSSKVYSINYQSFSGSGGISQAYLGVSVDIMKRLSLGINGYYMFGNIIHSRMSEQTFSDKRSSYSTYSESALRVNSFNARLGLQYHQPLNDTRDMLTVGAIYEMQHKLNSQYTVQTLGIDTVRDTLINVFQFPATYGFGATYSLDNRFLFGADVQYQQFSKVLFQNKNDLLNDRISISAGVEFTNRAKSNSYIDRMSWRLGANYSTSYVKVNNNSLSEYALSLGVGFPFRTNKSMINVLLQYGGFGTKQNNMIKEDYLKIGINFTLNDNWFYKIRLH